MIYYSLIMNILHSDVLSHLFKRLSLKEVYNFCLCNKYYQKFLNETICKYYFNKVYQLNNNNHQVSWKELFFMLKDTSKTLPVYIGKNIVSEIMISKYLSIEDINQIFSSYLDKSLVLFINGNIITLVLTKWGHIIFYKKANFNRVISKVERILLIDDNEHLNSVKFHFSLTSSIPDEQLYTYNKTLYGYLNVCCWN